MLEVGAVVGGKFRVDKLVGRGGMGVVAIATHLQLAQQVALKVLHEPLAADPTARDRFLREAQAPNRLKSDNVCRVFDVGTLDSGAPYIVMELLEGSDLASAGVLELPIAVDYVLQAMIAIAEAHALGIVHRDLKPANLFVTRRIDGTPLVKVLDFGIAKSSSDGDARLTHTAALMGSPGYMSPEQLRSARDVDARTDIWALGAILYELVSGRVPFPATSIAELAIKVATEPPDPLPAAPAYQAVVFRCLEKSLERRYQNVGELARDLAPLGGPTAGATAALIARLSGGTPVSVQVVGPSAATIATVTPVAVVPARSRVWLWLVAAVGLASVAVGVAFAVHGRTVATPIKPLADARIAIDPAKGAQLRAWEAKGDEPSILKHADYAGDDPALKAIVDNAKSAFEADIDRTVNLDIVNKDCEGAHEMLELGRQYVDLDALERLDDQCFATQRKLMKGQYQFDSLTSYKEADRLADLTKAEVLLGAGDFSAARLQADYVLGRAAADEEAAHVVVISSCHLHDEARARELFALIKKPKTEREDCSALGIKL